MKNKIFILSLILVAIAGIVFLQKEKLHRKNDDCLQEVTAFSIKMNRVDNRLNYVLAKNESALTSLLGQNYIDTTSVDGICYALVKNYNPLINENRFSILNTSNESLSEVLMEHEITGTTSASYRESFIEKYDTLFRK